MNLVSQQVAHHTQRLLVRLARPEYRERRLAIYGIGAVAETLLGLLADYRVVGLMDRDPQNVGKQIYGKRVLAPEEVLSDVDTIIIGSSDVYWRTIFQRIAHLKTAHGKEILFTNGDLGGLDFTVEMIRDNPYWERTASSFRRLIDDHEVISFDIFDTLICRKLARTDDLFAVVDRQAAKLLPPGCSFLQLRREAESRCRQRDPWCDIHQIYRDMTEWGGLPPDVTEALKQMELATEYRFAEPRCEVIDLYDYALRQGKPVYLLSDFHLPGELLTPLLEKVGVHGYRQLLVSCAAKGAKLDGRLWRRYRQLIDNRRALHIGDNEQADIRQAEAVGVTAGKLMGLEELLLNSSVQELSAAAQGLTDHHLLGQIQHRWFRNPFALGATRGVPAVETLEDFGYLFIGPLLYNFFNWLLPQLAAGGFDRVLFLAREGYLLERLYRRLGKQLGLAGMPDSIYFKTSRRMATVAALESGADIAASLQDSFSGTAKQLLQRRFGLDCPEEDDSERLVNSDPRLLQLTERHAAEILANAADERRCYRDYITGLGLREGMHLALVDIGLKGSIQHALRRIFPADYQGFYVTGLAGAANPYALGDRFRALYPVVAAAGKEPNQVYRYHILFESALVSPEGMYIRACPEGRFVNGPQFSNQRLFEQKQALHRGAENFVCELFATVGEVGRLASTALVEQLFGLPMGECCRIAECVKSLFYVDELYGVVAEKRIWDAPHEGETSP